MIYVAYAVALVMVAIAFMAIVGALLPRAHLASQSAKISAPPEKVFAAITDVVNFPDWRKDVARVEILPPENQRQRWREHMGGMVITMEQLASAAPRQSVARIADPKLPFGGTWTFDLRPDDSGTNVTITEKGEVYNPIFRFLSRFIFGYEATQKKYLGFLQQKFSAGAQQQRLET